MATKKERDVLDERVLIVVQQGRGYHGHHGRTSLIRCDVNLRALKDDPAHNDYTLSQIRTALRRLAKRGFVRDASHQGRARWVFISEAEREERATAKVARERQQRLAVALQTTLGFYAKGGPQAQPVRAERGGIFLTAEAVEALVTRLGLDS